MITDSTGQFIIKYDKEEFDKFGLDEMPDIYLVVTNQKGGIIYTSENAVRHEAGKDEGFTIQISLDLLDKELHIEVEAFSDRRERRPAGLQVHEAPARLQNPVVLGKALNQYFFAHVDVTRGECNGDEIKTVIRKLQGLKGLSVLFASWDEPRRGESLSPRMDEGVRFFQNIHDVVRRERAKAASVDPKDVAVPVLKALGLPENALIPIVIKSIEAHLKVIDKPDLLGP